MKTGVVETESNVRWILVEKFLYQEMSDADLVSVVFDGGHGAVIHLLLKMPGRIRSGCWWLHGKTRGRIGLLYEFNKQRCF